MKKLFFLLISLFAISTSAALFSAIGIKDGANLDPFQRLRTSDIMTLFDSKQLYFHDKSVFWDELTNATASTSFILTNACVNMSVAASNDYAIRQTLQWFNYQPAKGHLVFVTGTMSTNVRVVSRAGYFNSDFVAPYTNKFDGIYYEIDSGTSYICVAKSGAINRVPQSSWNVDKLDGSGASAIRLLKDRDFIFVADFEWLGVGRVRTGFCIDGIIYYTHYFNHANTNLSVYMTSPNHPVRYEIRSYGGSGTNQHICSSVNSEGGVDPNGLILAHEATNTFTVLTATENSTVLAFRLSTNMLGASVIFNEVQVACTSLGAGEMFKFEMVMNPSFTDTFVWTDIAPYSALQVASSPSLVSTGGIRTALGYVGGTEKRGSKDPQDALKLGCKINGTRDVIILRVTSMGANSDAIYTSVSWRELK